jgi:ketosteroid isomerase-like protein
MNNVDLIRFVYDSFSKGDAASVLGAFDDAVEFRLTEGHPYQPTGKPWIGKDAVAQNFFMRAAPEWERWTIQIVEIVETTNGVVVEARYHGTYKPTRKVMDLQVCHVWKVSNGKVTSFHQYVDTAGLHEVMGAMVSRRHQRITQSGTTRQAQQ